MFDWMYQKEPTMTEWEIKKLEAVRMTLDPTTTEYQQVNLRLKELYELREMERPRNNRASGDTKYKVRAGVAVAGGILLYEKLVGPVVSKVLPIATKMIGG